MKQAMITIFCIATLLFVYFAEAFALEEPPGKNFKIFNDTTENVFFYFKDCLDCKLYSIPPNQSVSDSTWMQYYSWNAMVMAAPLNSNSSLTRLKKDSVVRYHVYCQAIIPEGPFQWRFNQDHTCSLAPLATG